MTHYVPVLLSGLFGVVVGLVGIARIARLVCFSLPTSGYLKGSGALTSVRPFLSDLLNIIVRSGLVAGCTWLMWTYANTRFTPYLVGMAISVVLVLGRLGRSANNLSEYLDAHGRHVKPSTVEELREEVRSSRGHEVHALTPKPTAKATPGSHIANDDAGASGYKPEPPHV